MSKQPEVKEEDDDGIMLITNTVADDEEKQIELLNQELERIHEQYLKNIVTWNRAGDTLHKCGLMHEMVTDRLIQLGQNPKPLDPEDYDPEDIMKKSLLFS